jgi:SAM-dependent methyltransferase
MAMRPDVIDLRQFYASPMGQIVRSMVRERTRAIWPNLSGQRLLALGYATPYLAPFRDETERIAAAMPAGQGVVRWPSEGPLLATLVEDTELPFADASFDRVLLVHAIECTEHVRALMREVWRVLTSNGRLLAVVPNRRGLWARFEHTPFGQGHPYTAPQLTRLMRDNLFLPTATGTALYLPPYRGRTWLRSARAWENIGRRFFPHFAGVVLVEAEKQIYALAPPGARERRVAAALRPAPAGS